MTRRKGRGKQVQTEAELSPVLEAQQRLAATFARPRASACRESWYIVQTKAGKEISASVEIVNKGFQVFVPLRPATITRNRRRVDTVRPLFPRYIFTAFVEKEKTYGVIRYARGVSHLLCDTDGVPQPVPDRVVASVRKREQTLSAMAGRFKTGYQPGDEVKISVGPYADFIGKYLGEDRGKISVIILLFNRPMMVEVPIDAIPLCENSLDNAVA